MARQVSSAERRVEFTIKEPDFGEDRHSAVTRGTLRTEGVPAVGAMAYCALILRHIRKRS